MSITGEADGPPFRLGVAISDIVSGMFAFQGIAMALFARTTTGRGQHVDVGHARGNGGVADLSVRQLLRDRCRAAAFGKPASDNRAVRDVCRKRRGLRGGCWKRRVVARILPSVRAGRARRGSPIRDESAARVGLRRDPAGDRGTGCARRTRAEWIAALGAAGVPCGSVRDVGEVIGDPQLVARAMVEAVEHPDLGTIRVLGVPIKLSDTPGKRANGAANARAAHRRNPLGGSGVHRARGREDEGAGAVDRDRIARRSGFGVSGSSGSDP